MFYRGYIELRKSKVFLFINIVVVLFFFLIFWWNNDYVKTENIIIGTVESVGFEYFRDVKLQGVKFALLDSTVSKEYDFVNIYNTNNEEEHILAFSETHADKMIEILHQLLPNLEIDLYVVADENGEVNSSVFTNALHQIANVETQYDVINMSLYVEKDEEINSTLKLIFENGTILVAAAGNMGEDEQVYPASLDYVIGVGGINDSGELDSMSDYGGVKYFMPIKYRGERENYKGTSVSAILFSAAVLIIKSEKQIESIEQLIEYIDKFSHNPRCNSVLGKGQIILTDMT